jgi:hypothetical protein
LAILKYQHCTLLENSYLNPLLLREEGSRNWELGTGDYFSTPKTPIF